MPADFLLPIFALTLLANAILVAAAIRGLRRGSADADRPIDRGRPIAPPPRDERERPMTDELARAIVSRRAVFDEPGATDDATAATGGPVALPASGVSPRRAEAAPTVDTPVAPDTRQGSLPSPVAATVRRGPTTGVASPVAQPALTTAVAGSRRTRRKFALPPLDDDHERVSRSIETFLGGSEPTGSEAAAEAAPSSGAPLASAATTVALIAVDGLPRARRGRTSRTGVNDDATAAALAMVERTIRAAARGTDAVSVTAPGRYRIVLPGTGEVAVRAYLRRIRATVEPLLESADRPLRLAVATATVLDEPIGDAVRRAGARLTAARAALDAPHDDATVTGRESPGDPIGAAKPRASGD